MSLQEKTEELSDSHEMYESDKLNHVILTLNEYCDNHYLPWLKKLNTFTLFEELIQQNM